MPKDYFAEEIDNQTPSTGNILIDRKNILPTKRDYFTEEIGNTELVNKTSILSQVGLPGYSSTEQKIASRPDMMKSYQEEISQVPKSFGGKMLQPFVAGLKGIGGLMQRAEAVVANPGMTVQEGNVGLKDLANQSLQGLKGQRLGELGDIPRKAGVPEPISAMIGMGSLAGLTNLLSAGRVVGTAEKGVDLAKIKGEQALQGISNIPNKIFREGLTKEEALRIESQYGASNGSLIEQIKSKLNNIITQVDNSYKNAINSFKNKTIRSQGFYKEIQTGLMEKGWIDATGVPTIRFQSGLDPVTDKLTNLYLDMTNNMEKTGILSAKGQPILRETVKIPGQTIITKADFSTYRDALGSMLREKPSDVLVMKARNALYNSAEQSGMTGIKEARDLEKQAYSIEKRFLNRNSGDLKIATEAKLNRIGTDKPLSRQEMQHIEELQKYIKHPIVQDATNINKLNKAKETIKKAKQWGKGVSAGLIAGEVGRKTITGNW